MEEAAEQQENSKVKEWLRPWQFQPGKSGNPSGRPKGSVSLKQWAKNMLQTMTDEEKREFLGGLDKLDIWKMAEGNAMQGTDITSGGESLKTVLVKFIDGGNNDGNTAGVSQTL